MLEYKGLDCMKLSDYVMRFIVDRGINHVFMVAGGGAMHLNHSAGTCSGMEVVCNLHEQAAAIAAEAYSKITNNMGFALVTTGPGGTNAVTGVAGAWLDSTPCLYISGQVKRDHLIGNRGVRQFGFQEIDIISIVKPITKYAVTVMEPNTIRYHLEKALYLATHGRPGPVWLDIPMDVQSAQVEPDDLESFDPSLYAFSVPESTDLESQVNRAIDLISKAERPVIWGGNGIRLAHAQEDFVRMVDKLQIPVLLTWLGIDLLPEDHPLFVGRPGSVAPRGANFALQNSDLLLTIGARLDMGSTGYSHENLARSAKKIMVDVDDAEIKKMCTHIDLPVCADAGDFLRELLKKSDRISRSNRSAWNDRCLEWKKRYPVVLPEYYHTGKINTYIFSDILSKLLMPDELVVSASSGAGVEIFLLSFKTKQGQRVIHTASLGAMGFGLPASIGACLAAGGKRTILVDADGGFQLNSQELETISRLKLPVKMFVLNNQGYASIRTSQSKYFGILTGADDTSGLSLPDTLRLGRAYGVPVVRISSPDKLEEQIQAALDSPGPILCDVMIPTEEQRIPSLSTVQLPDGRMVSSPMEDLYPFLSREEFLKNMIVPSLKE
jgi:acetolactate synthase I/II/III large subunit